MWYLLLSLYILKTISLPNLVENKVILQNAGKFQTLYIIFLLLVLKICILPDVMRQTILSFENNRLIYRIQPADIAVNVESNEVDLLRSEIFALKERVALLTKRVEELERLRPVEIIDLTQDESFTTTVSVSSNQSDDIEINGIFWAGQDLKLLNSTIVSCFL